MTGAKDEYWWRFREIWDAIGPPLRPTADAVDAFRAAAPPEGKRLLILGVTPELADLGGRTIALDDSVVMVERVWPGNSDRRHALRGDWRSMPVRDGAVEVVFGDGSLNVVRFPSDAERIVAELDRVLAPGGRAVLRVYCTPEPAETLDEVARAAHAGEVDNVFELKWRVAMARVGAGSGPSIPVEEILEAFEAAFPDRRALAERCPLFVCDARARTS